MQNRTTSPLLGIKFFNIFVASVLIGAALSADSTFAANTSKGQPGLFRLMGAETFERDDYNLQTSMQFYQIDGLLPDYTVRRTQGYLAFGYALTEYLQLSGFGGFSISSRRANGAATTSTSGINPGGETIDVVKTSISALGTYDIGKNWLKMPAHRLTGGLNLELDLSKFTRFFKNIGLTPTFILTGDFSDAPVVPVRANFNLGLAPGNGARYFDSDDATVKDFDRLATDTINSMAVNVGLGAEVPLKMVTPSLELNMQYVADAGMSQSPKWITPGVKVRPFAQKNIELLAAVDIGISSNSSTPTGSKPAVGATPLWNMILGFSVNKFGKKANEIAVDKKAYETLQANYESRERILSGLQKDLGYNTVQGRVLDARTKSPLSGVTLSFPDAPDLKTSTTDEDGRFIRYFNGLQGARLVFGKEGFESSSKFIALKPSERVNVDVELNVGSDANTGAVFVATVTDPNGLGVPATIKFSNNTTRQSAASTADSAGQVNVRVPAGMYTISIEANGLQTQTDQVELENGKTTLRSYILNAGSGAPAPGAAPAPAPGAAPAPAAPYTPTPAAPEPYNPPVAPR